MKIKKQRNNQERGVVSRGKKSRLPRMLSKKEAPDGECGGGAGRVRTIGTKGGLEGLQGSTSQEGGSGLGGKDPPGAKM